MLLSVGQLLVASNKKKYEVIRKLNYSWSLRIKNVTIEDMGWYMCQLNTIPVKTQSGYINVHGNIALF